MKTPFLVAPAFALLALLFSLPIAFIPKDPGSMNDFVDPDPHFGARFVGCAVISAAVLGALWWRVFKLDVSAAPLRGFLVGLLTAVLAFPLTFVLAGAMDPATKISSPELFVIGAVVGLVMLVPVGVPSGFLGMALAALARRQDSARPGSPVSA